MNLLSGRADPVSFLCALVENAGTASAGVSLSGRQNRVLTIDYLQYLFTIVYLHTFCPIPGSLAISGLDGVTKLLVVPQISARMAKLYHKFRLEWQSCTTFFG